MVPQANDKYTGKLSQIEIELDHTTQTQYELDEYGKAINCLTKLFNMLEKSKVNKKLKEIFIEKEGIDILLDLFNLRSISNIQFIKLLFNVLNLMWEGNSKVVEQIYLNGFIEILTRLGNADNDNQIRIEVAWNIGLMYTNYSWDVFKIFIAAGGIKTIINFIDEDYQQNFELITFGLDSLISCFEKNEHEYDTIVSIMLRLNVLDRLLLVLDYFRISTHNYAPTYFGRLLDLINYFMAYGSKKVPLIIGNHLIMKSIVGFMNISNKINKKHLIKITEIITRIWIPANMEKLDEYGIMPAICNLYDYLLKCVIEGEVKKSLKVTKDQSQNQSQKGRPYLEVLYDVLKVIHSLCNMNPDRSEKASQLNFLRMALGTLEVDQGRFKNLILDILAEFVLASESSRNRMWNTVKGPFTLIALLDESDISNNAKIFDSLISWLKLDKEKMEDFLCEEDNFYQILKVLFKSSHSYSTQEYSHILSWLKSIIDISETVGWFIANEKDLVSKIVRQLNELKSQGIFKSDLGGYKSNESSKSGIHYYSQSSSHPGLHKNPYNIQNGHNMIGIIKELLEIIDKLISRAKLSPKKFIEKFKLYNILMMIYNLAHNNKLVILKALWEKLLKYTEESV